jgi:hypothetical protein
MERKAGWLSEVLNGRWITNNATDDEFIHFSLSRDRIGYQFASWFSTTDPLIPD